MAKAILQSRVRKGKDFKNGSCSPPHPQPRKNHTGGFGRPGNSDKAPGNLPLALHAAPAAEDGGCGAAEALTGSLQAGLWPPQAAQARARGAGRAHRSRSPPRPPGPAARRRGARSAALPGTRRLTPHPRPAPGLARLPPAGHWSSTRLLAVPITFPRQMWHVMGRVRDNVTFCTV